MAAGGLRFSWVDVFTDRPFAGNPLAVVTDADRLGDTEMAALARELGLSETIFVHGGGHALRIFTPGGEVPLAGHPVVGAAVELARLGRIPSDGRTVFSTGRGDIPVEVRGGTATMTQAPPELGDEIDAGECAALLGLPAAAIEGTPRLCSTAWPIAFAKVRDRTALRTASPDQAALAGWPVARGMAAWCEGGEGELVQRFFAPQLGISEDPATGAAAGALGALRVFEGARPGALVVRQGEEVGRPSRIEVSVGGEPGRPVDARVGGAAVLVLEGVIAPSALGA